MNRSGTGRLVRGLSWMLIVCVARAQAPAPAPGDPASLRRKVEQAGISVDFAVDSAASPGSTAPLREGDPVAFRFTLSDAATGKPLINARPAAWLDRVPAGETRGPELCEKKFRTFLGGGLGGTPDLNLNVYYVLTLNSDGTMSVLDPIVGFGGSKLLAMVKLKSPGFDWALTTDQSKLFVSLPDSNELALVDTKSWAVAGSAEVAVHPGRVAIQPDQQYVWVASEASGPDSANSGVSVFSVSGMKLVARIVTGRGGHEIEFTEDSRYAFVSNSAQNTVSVIDVRTLKKVRDVATGSNPVSMAYSAKVGAVLISNRGDGSVTVLDPKSDQVSKIQTAPGVSQIRFAPAGRYAFAINPGKNEIYIVDGALRRLVQTFDVQSRPDQVSFTENLAYIRHSGSEQVLMVPLDQIGEAGKAVPVVSFPGGKHPPGEGTDSPANGIVQAAGDVAVLVANPKDRTVYYYSEGMAAPVGTFDTGGHEPKAVMVVDRSLRIRPGTGIYETTGIMGPPGLYDVVFFMDSPKIVHCFGMAVQPNPELEAKRGPRFDVRYADGSKIIPVGESHRVEFRLTNTYGLPIPDATKDLSALVFQVPGIWRNRVEVMPGSTPGTFAVSFTPPRAGVYYLNIESRGIKLNPTGSLILRAVSAAAGRQ